MGKNDEKCVDSDLEMSQMNRINQQVESREDSLGEPNTLGRHEKFSREFFEEVCHFHIRTTSNLGLYTA